MRKYAVAVLALAAAALLRPGFARATTAADICPDVQKDCELRTGVTVTPGSTLDFGGRTFVIGAPDGRLQIGSDDSLSIFAGNMEVETVFGGRIRSTLGSSGGCSVRIQVTGTFATRHVAGPFSVAIDLSSPANPCVFDVDADGDVTIAAQILARGTGETSPGGEVFIGSGGRITVSDRILVDTPADGGTVELAAEGPIEVTDTGGIDASDGAGIGSIFLNTGADLVTAGRLDVKGRPSADEFGCNGGLVFLDAAGDVTINGPISGTGFTLPSAGCEGGTLNVQALGGSVFVNAPIDFSGGPNGLGPIDFEMNAGRDLVQTAPILVGAGGPLGGGGFVTLSAGRRLHIGALVNLSGGPEMDPFLGVGGSGGYLTATARETIEIAGEVVADGRDYGSLVFTTASPSAEDIPGRIVVTGDVRADSIAEDALAADIRLEACEIEITDGGRVEKTGPASRNLLRASATMKIAGTLEAGTGSNELEHRDPMNPPLILPTARVSPAATITATPDEPLRPCACTRDPTAAGLFCDDGNACTQETCVPGVGCSSTPLTGEGIPGCDDGNVCDGREVCEALDCRPGPVPPVDDGDPCTDDGPCDPASGYPRTAKTGFGAATCRIERIQNALATASVPGDASAKSLKKVRKLAGAVRLSLEKAAGAQRKRRARLLRAATTKLKRLDKVLAAPKTSISPALSQLIKTETSGVRTALTQL